MRLLPEDPQQRQKVLLGLLLVALLGFLSYRYVYTPRTAEVAALRARVDALDEQNGRARALVQGQGVEAAEAQLRLHREQLKVVEGLIPSAEELPDLLDAIAAEAQRTGVDLALIQPVDAQEERFYTRRTYDLAVLGSFHAVGDFLTRVASLPRIVTPFNLSLTVHADSTRRSDLPQLEAKFGIETYVLPPLALEPAAEDTAHVE